MTSKMNGKAKGDSYTALFGPPPPRFPKNRRSFSAAPVSSIQRRRVKPMPVNPLTGEQIGKGGIEVPKTAAPCIAIPDFSRFKRPPPGGYTTQLW